MKLSQALTLLFCAATLVGGCGGGGGGSSSSGGGGGTSDRDFPYAGTTIEFYSSYGSQVESTELQVGQKGNMLLVYYDGAGNRTVLTASSWALSRTTTAYIGLNTGSGAFSVISRPSNYFVITAYRYETQNDGTSAEVAVATKECYVPASTNTTISGSVMAEGTTKGVGYIQVEFLDGSGNYVGGKTTATDGSFVAKVASNVKTMSIYSTSIPTTSTSTMSGFYRMISYGGKYYTPDSSGCNISVGTITSGASNALASVVYLPLQSSGPPPFPNGCSQ